ncbi:MAG TPA: hypothetical protein VE075_11025 [Thermoanaerobaculia bacterium]|nr:hypothetical protein [Thermoanaerobaculia bacterium]
MPAPRRLPGWLLGGLGLGSALLLQPALPGRCGEARQQDLRGSWTLNADLTARLSKDQHAEEGDQGGEGRGRHRAGLGAMGPTGGDPTAPGTGDWSPAKERHDAEARKEVVALLDSLTIVQQGAQVTITDQSGHARVLKTDGSKVRDQGPAGPVQLRASWDRDGSLVVEVKPDKGTRRTESYLVSNDGKHLYLTVAISGQRDPVLRAYDLAAAPPAAP